MVRTCNIQTEPDREHPTRYHTHIRLFGPKTNLSLSLTETIHMQINIRKIMAQSAFGYACVCPLHAVGTRDILLARPELRQ